MSFSLIWQSIGLVAGIFILIRHAVQIRNRDRSVKMTYKAYTRVILYYLVVVYFTAFCGVQVVKEVAGMI